MDQAVGAEAWLAALLRFEAGLAMAQARLGLIPAGAAEAIGAACDPSGFDLAEIGRTAVGSATPVVPLVEALRRAIGGTAAEYVHQGATSQDAIDTAMMLVARDGVDLLLDELAALGATCAALAQRHRDTPMAGRTLLVRARPITFGFKTATWLMAVQDTRARLADIRDHRLAVQLGGAVGTRAAFGPAGARLVGELARELGLAEPGPLAWHADRGRVAELGAALAIAAGTAAKIALDVILLSQTEIGEVAEASPGRSSAMPDKRNPAHAVQARAAFALVQGQASVLIGAIAGEHERAAGAWQAEPTALSDAFRHAAGAVARAGEALAGIEVHEDRMRTNAGPLDEGDLGAAGAQVDRALAAYRAQMKERP